MTLARWQNKKLWTSFPHRDAKLTIYSPKSLYENSRNLLWSHSSPGKFKLKNSHIETGEESHFTPTTIAPTQQTSARLRRIAQLAASLLGGKRRREHKSRLPDFQRPAQETGFYLIESEVQAGNQYTLDASEPQRAKRAQCLLKYQGTCSDTDRHQRAQETISSWKRKWQTSLRKDMHKPRGDMSLEKVWVL